jgi:hypothetical protein
MKIRRRCLTFWAASVRGRATAAAGFRGTACTLALLMLAGLARPAAAAGEEAAQAAAHLQRAAAASNLGNYADAAREYEAAYMKTWDPNLLVHVGQTWQLAGDRQKALTAFHSYVRVAPGGEQRALCEARIREIEGQPAGPPMVAPFPGAMGPPMMAAPPPPLPYPAPPPPPPATSFATTEARAPVATESPVYHRWPFWIIAATVVVGGTAVALWYTRDKDLAMPTTTFGTKQF